MVISLDSLKEPIGSIKPWIRPNISTPIPVNWLICDGSTVVDSASPFNGLAIPDYRSRFTRGHNLLTNANFGSDTNYYAGSPGIPAGGTDTNNLAHAHTEAAHAHSITADGAAHTHANPDTSEVGNTGGGGPGLTQLTSGSDWTAEIHNISLGIGNSYSHHHTIDATGTGSANHTHTGATGTANGTGTGSNLSASTENRPVFTEYVHIIKIK